MRAVDLANLYCEVHNFQQDNQSIVKGVEFWYSKSDITNPKTLAALTLEFGILNTTMIPYLYINNKLEEITKKYFL